MKNWIFLLALSWAATLTAQNELKVYVFLAEECPISIAMAAPLRTVAGEFGDAVTLHAVFPNRKSTETTAATFLREQELTGFSILLDSEQRWARRLHATITPEAVVTDAAGQVLYRGRINNAYAAPGKVRHGARHEDLQVALRQLQNGEAAVNPWPPAVGCFITFFSPVDGK